MNCWAAISRCWFSRLSAFGCNATSHGRRNGGILFASAPLYHILGFRTLIIKVGHSNWFYNEIDAALQKDVALRKGDAAASGRRRS
jgi:hypothetical protein